jgi:hypothetical protein
VIPTLPPALRNRLADTILAAFHEPSARSELAALASASETTIPPGWLAHDERAHAPGMLARARQAHRVLAPEPWRRTDVHLADALAAAGVLFDAGLHFEVHELLEPHWAHATGSDRDALQGLIQVAVGFQHLANGNVAGARALLGEGSLRLSRSTLPGLEAGDFVRAVTGVLERLPDVAAGDVPRFPRSRETPR